MSGFVNPAEAQQLAEKYGLSPSRLGLVVRRGPGKTKRRRPRREPAQVLHFNAIRGLLSNLRQQRNKERLRLTRVQWEHARLRVIGTIRGLDRAIRQVQKLLG